MELAVHGLDDAAGLEAALARATASTRTRAPRSTAEPAPTASRCRRPAAPVGRPPGLALPGGGAQQHTEVQEEGRTARPVRPGRSRRRGRRPVRPRHRPRDADPAVDDWVLTIPADSPLQDRHVEHRHGRPGCILGRPTPATRPGRWCGIVPDAARVPRRPEAEQRRPRSSKRVIWRPAGPSRRALSESTASASAGRPARRPPRPAPRVAASASVDLEGDPQRRRHPAADLDLVDHRDLGRVGQLQGGPAGVEDHDVLAVVAGEVELDRQAERVAVERHRGVEVLGLDDQAELADPGQYRCPPRRASVPGASHW